MMGEDIERAVASLPTILKKKEEQRKTTAALAFRQDEYASQQAEYAAQQAKNAAQQAEYLAAMKTSNWQLEALTLQVTYPINRPKTSSDKGDNDTITKTGTNGNKSKKIQKQMAARNLNLWMLKTKR
ncbi:unnamed protein product [Cochlearia groenlandica]